MTRMEKYTVAFPSVTHANKAKDAFVRRGLTAKVIRTPKTLSMGCGFSVQAEGKLETIKEILEDQGIHYRAIS